VEATLEMLASALRDVKGRVLQLFAQERTASNAGLFLDGLISDEQRKTGWMRSEVVGDPGPWRQQELLGRDRWDADALRDVVREYAVEHLHDDEAVLVIDETGFLKQGKKSCGVARQYTGSAGKSTNCQIGIFATYASRYGHSFVDRALYLPKSWTDNPIRLKATYDPKDVGFATRPQLAARMIGAGSPLVQPVVLRDRLRLAHLQVGGNQEQDVRAALRQHPPKFKQICKACDVCRHATAAGDGRRGSVLHSPAPP